MNTSATAAEAMSSSRRSAGGAFANSSETRMWPPARNVMAAPNVKVAAIRYDDHSQATGMLDGTAGIKFETARTNTSASISAVSDARHMAPNQPSKRDSLSRNSRIRRSGAGAAALRLLLGAPASPSAIGIHLDWRGELPPQRFISAR